MFAQLINVFRLLKTSVPLIFIFLIYNLFKYALMRRNLSLVPFSYGKANWHGHSFTTYIMEMVKAFFHIFKKEEIFCAWISYYPFICLNSPDAVEELLNGTKAMEKGWIYNWLHCWLGTGLLTSHGKKWKSRRKQLTPAFHFDILKDFLPVINEKSQQLIKILEKETTKDFTNIVTPVTLCSLDIICETTLGVNIKAQENSTSDYVKAVANVSEAITERIGSIWSWFDFTWFLTYGRQIKKDLKLLHNFTNTVIQEKKNKLLNNNDESTEHHKNKRKALMDILLEHHVKHQDLSEENIREEVDTFTFEGHDTTSMALSWALYLTGLHKDIQAKAHEELDEIFGNDLEKPVTNDDLKYMKYIECILKETLRLYPSVALFGRQADPDMTFRGYEIPNGSTLIVCPYMLHRNEQIFPNPEKFDPERFTIENSTNRHPYAYVPFSAGSRNCIGQRFAMMELKTVYSQILRNFTLESLDPRDKVLDSFGIILRPTKGIRIKLRHRSLNKIEAQC